MKKILYLFIFVIVYVSASAQNGVPPVEDAFNSLSRIEGMQKINDIGDDLKFPKKIGKPTMLFYENGVPCEEVTEILSRLPRSMMELEYIDDNGRVDRIYLDESNNNLLFAHVGIEERDTIIILFKGGKRKDIDKFIKELNERFHL